MSERILVIDDDQDILTYFSKYLVSKGYKVMLADTGKKGLEIFEQQKPDIVFCDIILPDIDGIKILYMLNKTSPVAEVVLMTAYIDNKVVIQALREGIVHYLEKPFLNEDIDNAIEQCRKKIKQRDKSNNLFFERI